jgi:hypothetical protein
MTALRKSNILRMLEARHIPYQVYTYATDPRVVDTAIHRDAEP